MVKTEVFLVLGRVPALRRNLNKLDRSFGIFIPSKPYIGGSRSSGPGQKDVYTLDKSVLICFRETRMLGKDSNVKEKSKVRPQGRALFTEAECALKALKIDFGVIQLCPCMS